MSMTENKSKCKSQSQSQSQTNSSSSPSPSSTNLYQFLVIVCGCIICYYNSVQCDLVFDDISAIRDNKDLRPHTPLRNIFLNDFWGTPMRKEQSHKSYRPLTVLTFRANYWMHGLEPYGYHLVNVVLHIVVCLLWRRASRLLLLNCAGVERTERGERDTKAADVANACSFVAALLFAVHPIHTEAVTGVVGRAELLSSIFLLLTFLLYAGSVSSSRQQTKWLTLLFGFSSCLLASMLCKEQGITISGICIAYELFVVQQVHPLELWHVVREFFDEKKITSPAAKSNKNNILQQHHLSTPTTGVWTGSLLKRICFLVCCTVALLVLRVYVMGSQLPVFTRFDNPASAADTPRRQLTYCYLIYINCWLLLFPCDLCCDWTMGTLPLIEGFMDVRNIKTLFTFASLLIFGWHICLARNRQHSRILLMCLVWMVLPFLPASNLFFPVGFVVAERILYMPSMGFSLLVAYGYFLLHRRCCEKRILKYIIDFALIALILSHACKTFKRNEDWRTEYKLYMAGVHVNGRNAKLFNNVGHALENEGRYKEALVYFEKAVEIQPDDIGAHINVGRTYNHLKMYKEAETAYLAAKSLFPKIKPGESYQARVAPNHLKVFINLANLIAKNHTRLEEADHLYRQAISMRADYVQAYINRGDILMKMNRTAQAQEVYEKALLYDSDNADIYYNLGVVVLQQGKSAQAIVYFNKALELYPEHEQALFNSAMLLQEMGGPDAYKVARARFYKILEKDANNEKAYFNLGMLAMDESNFDEAEQFFKRAIHIKEDLRSALFNLALLLADTNRSLEAVPYLNQLIRHHPKHTKGLILLGDIYINQMKDLDAAEVCYRSILEHDPHNVQGLHNLCVVYVERKLLAKAAACLKFAHHLAPHEDYILRHWKIVSTRLQKISKLPDDAKEKQRAYEQYDPLEFRTKKEEDT